MSDQIKIQTPAKKRPVIIGINGLAGAGKDTISEMVRLSLSSEHKLNVKIYSFAGTLKQAASIIFGVPLVQFYDQTLKEQVNDFWGMSPRQMAQKLGTEACRNGIRNDIWVKSLEATLNNCGADIAFITDVRFDNEAEFILNYSKGSNVFNLFRNDHKPIKDSGHASEQGIDDNLVSHFIENVTGNPYVAAGTLQSLVLAAIEESK